MLINEFELLINSFHQKGDSIYFNGQYLFDQRATTNSAKSMALFSSIYNDFYASYRTIREYSKSSLIDSIKIADRFNKHTDVTDYGWKSYKDNIDTKYLWKNNAIKPHNFNVFSAHENYKGTSQYVTFIPKRRITEGFYYINSINHFELEPSLCIRIYFNLSIQGRFELLEYLTTDFSTYHIPFKFKFVVSPHHDRTDNSILYLKPVHFNLVYELLGDVMDSLNKFLRNEIPPFTKQLRRGCGFAESPVNIDDSFGTSRCRFIAEILSEEIVQNIEKERLINALIHGIERLGYHPNRLYLNPKSSWNYNFTINEE